MVTINNLDYSARGYKYIMYRIVDGENWYWGASNDVLRCSEICAELGSNARIIESENVQ